MFKLLKVGHCFHPEAIVTPGSSWKSAMFPATVALLQHPTHGYILFDTGYAQRFHTATRAFPQRIYSWVTPMELSSSESLEIQLEGLGIGCEDISYIFISHFHADHIAGLKDFPHAKYLCARSALEDINRWSGFSAVRRGYLSELLPEDFAQRVLFLEDSIDVPLPTSLAPFSNGYDLFGDGAYIAISLPGHSSGHTGLLFEHNGIAHFLLGDACWTANAYKRKYAPHALTKLVLEDYNVYLETIDRLGQLYGNNHSIELIPSHCLKTYEGLCSD